MVAFPKKTPKVKKSKSLNSKTGNKGLKTKLDTVFSLYIRARDKYTCCTCGITAENALIDNGHYIPRAILSLRWDETNCHPQCKSCNGAHNIDREPYRQYILNKYGEEKLIEFSEKSRLITKLTRGWYLEKIAYYSERI